MDCAIGKNDAVDVDVPASENSNDDANGADLNAPTVVSLPSASHSQPHSCDYCNKTFKLKSSLRRHLRHSHVAELIPEGRANSTTETNEMISEVSTVLQQRKRNEFICDVCNKKFARKYHLCRHKQLTSCSGDKPPPSHPCELCDKVYTRKDNLRDHLRAHAGQTVRRKHVKCDKCDKEFRGASLLRIHERVHTGEKPYKCVDCEKAFPSSGSLAKHSRTHTGEKPYFCKECNARFSLKGTLNRHMRIHTGIRPHKCPYCSKQFIQAGGLRAHMFYHTGQNGFECEICHKVFNRKARVQMHKKYVHEKEKPFGCPKCAKRFTRKEDLVRHEVLHSGDKPHKCPTCSKSFAIKPSLKLHLLTHTKEEPRSCHECGRAFIRKDCLLRHMRRRHKGLVDKILPNVGVTGASEAYLRVLTDDDFRGKVKELLALLVDEQTLTSFGWPDKPVDEVLESVIKRCGHTPVGAREYTDYSERLKENSKLLFTVVIDDNAVKTLLNNQTVDEVIQHVLHLAKS